ncbi:MAG: glycoside hydrolase family 3 N-terminal domain-containing protein [Cellulosilyticaceae bacterium]
MEPFQNKTLTIEARIKDLLSKMTLEEKVRQMDLYSGNEFKDNDNEFDWDKWRAICGKSGVGCLQNRYAGAKLNNEIQRKALEQTRLPIPILFSEEALHGLIWPKCTMFPQQITLAGTFEPELAKKQGHAIAAECRSAGIHETWAPVVDLARDPRWGRVEEGYGEDTYLAARFAENMVRGLQGENLANQDTIVAEPKHFSGYGAPTGGLNCAPAMMGKHEHAFYCLPVFEAAFNAGALNTMCSYNSIDSIPVACDHHLLTEVLRGKLGMQGFVRADMTAISMLHTCHFVAETPRDAIRMATKAGVDMQLYDFSHEVYQENLISLVETGEMEEAEIDLAVSRILRVKFMLGLFENPYVDESLCEKVMHCEEHVAVAKEVAEKSICLLKNKNNVLPLSKNLKKIAVIGPSADVLRYGDYSLQDGNKLEGITVLEGIKNSVSTETEVLYAKGCDILESEITPIPASWLKDDEGKEGLKAQYFNAWTFENAPQIVRNDEQICFNWIFTKPAEGVDADRFAVRWCGVLLPEETFEGLIGLSSMDSMRLWLDGVLVVDCWDNQNSNQMVSFKFEKGKKYSVKIEFINDARGARVIFGYKKKNNDQAVAIAMAKTADVAIVAVGDSEETCGENLDRTDLNLPGKQLELVKAIYDTGTPVVLVIQNGRPLSLTWENDHIQAIVEAWFPGEQGGNAIANVLFGDINPSGKLPMSFPKSVGQVPVHYNRRPFGGKKYVEMDWNPLYPFGYGLSYTTFEYSNLVLSNDRIAPGESVCVTIDVTNTGNCYGEDVPQLYIHDTFSSVIRPYKELAGFKKVGLSPGETKCVTFELGEKQLRLLNQDFEWVVEKGTFDVMIGHNAEEIVMTTILCVE